MMNQPKRLKFIIIVIMAIAVIGFTIYAAYSSVNRNQYGDEISIGNYDQLVKNISKDYKDAITAALYKTALLNSTGKLKPSDIKDATIRDGSVSQEEIKKDTQYSGKFIVDIASLKQSYNVQYTYSTDPDDPILAGYPVLVSCLDVKDLKYGDFNCKDTYVDKSKQDDSIVGYLPYDAIDFGITANTTSGSLVLYAELKIPTSNMGDSVQDKQAVISMYKKEVTDWISGQGLDPTKYTIVYNYDENGNPVNITPLNGD